MDIIEMLGQSGVLSLLGMSVVFGFLIILVIAVTVMGKIVHALGMDKDLVQAPNTAAGGAGKSMAVTAAITAAVTEYQKNEKGVKNA
jgi:oxaloacetate decarboxylase gamma subunit